MTSQDPLDPVDIRKVYISEARCNSHLLHPSKRYRLHFTIQPPATVTGLRSPKSNYTTATHKVVMWKDPFGDEFTVTPTPIDCRVIIDLREHHFGRSGLVIASCSFDLPSATEKEIRLDLKHGATDKFGELIICVASSMISTRDVVQNSNRAAKQLGPSLGAVNDAIRPTAPLATQITAHFNAWQPLLRRLDALVKVADTVAEVHPWIKLAWGVASAAYKVASAQSVRDATVVMELIPTMANACSFADEADELTKRSKTDQDIINQILRQVMECAYFIRDYCRDESFIKRTVKNTVSPVDARINNYKRTLEALQRNLIDHASIECTVITHRVFDVVTEVRDFQVLNELKYAPEAHHDLDQGCLPGTRTEIIDAVMRWAVGADTPSIDSSGSITLRSNESSRVLWLCGTAGAGKSSILRSCAKRVSELERQGSYYGFDKNQPSANLTNLFSTIARDLADLDNSRKQRLVDGIKNDTAIRRTGNCKLQFQRFIIASFEGDQALGETVVFIDAFDESGDVMARTDALAVLTKRASELPPGLRVVITSRFEHDIQEALQSPLPPGVDIMLLDDIPTYQTSRDIKTYIHSELQNVKELREKYETQLKDLIHLAGTSFQWAATACRFIRRDNDAGVGPRDRIATVLHSDEGLYALYSTVMKEHCNPSIEIAVKRVKSVLGRILCTQEALSLRALVYLVPPDSVFTPDDGDIEIQRGIVKHLASLLSGTHSDHAPIVPLHTSYRDFLCNAEHNKDFYIDKDEANQDMALACFRVMDKTLAFNICQIPTSFLCNADIPNLKDLREKHIPDYLYYACRFWGFHLVATPSIEFAQDCMESFLRKDFLHWSEVISIMQTDAASMLTSLRTSNIAGDLAELLWDAIRFLIMFAPVANNTPHIYLSGLTFAPASSLLYQQWRPQFPGVAKLAQGQLEHWPNARLLFAFGGPLALSPDALQIAFSTWGGPICVWNTETSESIGQPIEGHHGSILSIAFSSDAKQIAAASEDMTIQLWNVKTGTTIGQQMKGCHGSILSLAFSPDAKQIASGSNEKTIQFWNVATGATIGQPMEGHDDVIQSLAFSPDGKQIASSSMDKTIRLWNVETGASIGQPIEEHDDHIWAIVFSPDGKQIAATSRNYTLQFWNVETGARIGQPMVPHDNDIFATAKKFVSGPQPNTVEISQFPTAEDIPQYPAHLFPPPPSPFQLDDGWILGPNGEFILWVPPAYRASLEHPHSHIVGNPNATWIDFQHFKCGTKWAQCQVPVGEVDDASSLRDL